MTTFFRISGNEQTIALQNCKSDCKKFLQERYDSEIHDIYSVINAMIIYFETDDKNKSKQCVTALWVRLNAKIELSFFEIRIMKYLLFIESSIERVIDIVSNCSLQLDGEYHAHKDYMSVKLALQLNLIILLMDAKFFDEKYSIEYDELIAQIIYEVITLNLESRMNNKYFVGIANIYQGILLKNRHLIYTGFLLLESSTDVNNNSITELIKFYAKKYNISIN